jgi:hypothetical protein
VDQEVSLIFWRKKSKCPQCGKTLGSVGVWTLNNGVRLHGGCWPQYFHVKGDEAISRAFNRLGVKDSEA